MLTLISSVYKPVKIFLNFLSFVTPATFDEVKEIGQNSQFPSEEVTPCIQAEVIKLLMPRLPRAVLGEMLRQKDDRLRLKALQLCSYHQGQTFQDALVAFLNKPLSPCSRCLAASHAYYTRRSGMGSGFYRSALWGNTA